MMLEITPRAAKVRSLGVILSQALTWYSGFRKSCSRIKIQTSRYESKSKVEDATGFNT